MVPKNKNLKKNEKKNTQAPAANADDKRKTRAEEDKFDEETKVEPKTVVD